jgi:hypothetical protein
MREMMTGKGLKVVLLIVMLLFSSIVIVVPSMVRADSNGTYIYTVNGGQATITGYIGTDAAITIPSTLGTYPVVAIGNGAFTGVNSVLSVTIPGNINLIGNTAFLGCNYLASITVDGANTHYASSAGVLYSHDMTTLVNYPKLMVGSHFDIPEGVITIGDQAFFSVSHLTSVTIPDSVSSVGNEQFQICSSLTSIAVDSDSPYYASSGGVLYSHDMTTLVVYPNGLTTAVFTIPSTVTKIYPFAFYGSRVTTVNFPNGVKSIGDYAFNQGSLTSLIIPDSVTSLGNYTFYNLGNLISASIGNGATYVGQYTFYYCYRMTSASIGRNVTYIGEGAFGQCPLSSVNIPVNVTSIGRGAFWQAHISSVTIPAKVRSIGDYAFKGCLSLTSVTIPNNVTSMGNMTFSGCSVLASAVIGNGSTYVGSQAFSDCPVLTSVLIGANVTNIDNSAFQNCVGLTSITIPGKVTRIGSSTFQGCTYLSSMKFLGRVAPTSVGTNWITGTNLAILGHAYLASNFPVPGQSFNGLLMAGNIPQVPGAPTGLAALAGNAQVTLNWTAPVNNGGATIDHYVVYENGAAAGTFTTLAATITGLTFGQTYIFKVAAHNSVGNGPNSTAVNGMPINPITLTITSPTNNFLNNTGSVTVKWTESDRDSSLAMTEIKVDSGSWNVVSGTSDNISGLSEGPHIIFMTALDYAGNVNTTSVTFTVDTIAPSVSIISPTTGSYNDTGSVTVKWNATDSGSGIAKTEIKFDSGSWNIVSGSSDILTSLAAGSHTVTVRATDYAGNMNTASVTFTVDTVAPSVRITSPTSGSYNNSSSSTVQWTASDSGSGIAKMEIKLDTGSWSTIAGTTDTLTSLADGSHTVTVRVTDNAGNVNSASASFVVDTVAPVLSINSPTSGSYNNTGSVTVSWTATDGGSGIAKTEINVDSGPWTPISGTGYSLTSMANGAHTVTIRATDNAGNMNTESVTFTVDTVKPVLNIVAPVPDSWYNTTALNATWTASDSGSGIAYFRVSLDKGQWINGTNEYQMLNGLTNGQHTIEVRAYDKAGNYNDTALLFNVEMIKPKLTITTPIENACLNLSAVEVSWNANSASGIANYWVSVDSGVWTDVAKDTSYSFASLADGSHVVTLRAENNVGDYNETSVSFTIDTVAPTVTEHSSDGGNMSCKATTWASFSELMNTSSVRAIVNGVNGTLTWSGNNVTFSPTAKLAYDTTYHVTVTGKDLAGNVVEYSWSFTTMKNEGTIEGAIKDADGNPIANATVTLSNGMTTMTDVKGHFSFENVPSGNYTMNTTKAGLKPITQSVSASAGQTNELEVLSMIVSPSSASSDNSFILGAAAILVVALIALSLLFIRRRKNKEE